MANPEHLERLAEGVAAWNRWRAEQPDVKPDLSAAKLADGLKLDGIDLSDANLKQAFVRKVSLRGAVLRRAKLDNAYLRAARLDGADLSRASLAGANLRHAVLRDAKLPGAYLRRIDLSYCDLTGADLTRAVLEYGRMVDCTIEGAVLTEARVYGVSAWNLEGTPKDQSKLRISRLPLTRSKPPEPRITVDDLAVAQFIHLLINYKNLRNVFNAMTQRGVLILGRFGGGGLAVLQAVAAKLRELGYTPMIFDFDRPQDRNYTETVQTLVGLSRFVIADLSGPSVPQELYATVPHYKVPFAPILEAGANRYAMFSDLREYDWVLAPFRFASVDELIAALPEKVVDPAEAEHERLRKRRAEIAAE
jgi:uncharacterized protein YjbI with pentapeptide repeats